MRRLVIAVVASSLLAGCATRGSNYRPLVDMQHKAPGQYETDVAECQAYAKQRADAAAGAIAGAIVGAALMAFIAPRGYRNYAAGRGAGVGAMSGAFGANENQETIVKRCLAGRGYNVLD